MDAITKNWISEEQIQQMTDQALGHPVAIQNIKRLSGGFCSAVYLVETAEEKMVLKLASGTGVKVMRNEVKYIPTEAEMLKLFQERLDIPMPKLLFYDDSGEICDVPYFFMSYLDGVPLCDDQTITDAQRADVKKEMGVITRKICSLKADIFGIPNIPESYCKKNSDFINLLFDWLLCDAEEKGIAIPGITSADLKKLIRKYGKELDEVTGPVYVHTDTWDGNLLIKNGKLTGLIDYAAVLWADPLLSHDFHDFGDVPNPYFLQGYGKIEFTQNEKIRIQIYREYEDPHMYDWVLDDFAREVEKLETAVMDHN